jgi:polyphosphate glucokinase
MVVTIGTGVGTSLVVDRHLVPNVELAALSVRGRPGGERVANSVRKRKRLSWRAWSADLERFINALDDAVAPDAVIIGGGVSEQAHRFVPDLRCRPVVVPARLRNNAGIVGAALYAWEREEHVDERGSEPEVLDVDRDAPK